MKVAQVVTGALFASTASAYWVRGAAERAMYYTVYMMEDVHYNNKEYDGWKIARDCQGSRRGLWGQKGRCNLAEFLDYIWAPTADDNKPGSQPDTRPRAADIDWPKSMSGIKKAQAITSMIMGAKYKDGSSIMVHDTDSDKRQYGYTGKINTVDKLWPGSGVNSYYDSLAMFGERAVKLNDDFEAAVKDGTIKTAPAGMDPKDPKYKEFAPHMKAQETFRGLYQEATNAAESVVDLRNQDKWKNLKDKGDWKNKLGVEPVWEMKKSSQSWIGEWEELKEGDTIARMEKDLGLSHADAVKKYDQVWASNNSSPQNKQHAAALEKARISLKTFQAKKVCP
ncbi:hypothetical protein B0H66DRAFT_602518 [Apodospora peruviana]|uniref:Uncharacterized protein n=1 Tax=Apodospora peruviana TaxID=516989 RepID=A0AAE0I440_9PEZI|nr:hypothetical protein B0H66DRAFT_602518 [Apodospora peruviana]